MTFIMTLCIVLLLIGVPLLKMTEKQIILRHTDEKILLEINEKVRKRKVFLYLLFAIVLLFLVQVEEVTFYLAITKLLLIIGVYLAMEQWKTRLYITNQHVYLVTRFRKKKLMRMERFKKNQLYRIDLIDNNPNVYRLYFKGTNQYLDTLDITLTKREDILLFRTLIKKHLDIYINEPVDIPQTHINQEQPMLKTDTLTKYFGWAIVGFGGYGWVKTTLWTDGHAQATEVVSTILSLEFIPFALYLMSYVYLRTAKVTKRIGVRKKGMKELSFYYAFGSAMLPFAIIMNHGVAEGTRYLIVHGIGIFLFTSVLIFAWSFGKITYYLREKEALRSMEQLLLRLPKRTKKSA